MESTAIYGVFAALNVAFVAGMVWLYSAWEATTFLGMAAFGMVFLAALTAAAFGEVKAEAPEEREADVSAPSIQPA